MTTTQAMRALEHGKASVRLQAALAVGTHPDPGLIEALVERCAVEPDFYVRDMLTWALTRHPAATTVPRLVAELGSAVPQARSQALHTLSKIGDKRAWPAITRALLTDPADEVARSAWRAAVVLLPSGETASGATASGATASGEIASGETASGARVGGEAAGLAAVLVTQLGRGGRETQLSLSRALTALGEVVRPALSVATASPDPRVRRHAAATEKLLRDPDAGFEFAIEEAKRIVALGPDAQEG
ncbi:HEAT repeat domain-containing protein [Dactylosporangium sp. NPDC005555]|uniref:HEAT repeat domain-containing protein n=1 Tax=Dactylosporangium sp. NPDC005555 TaxID=3154889 RepID=UPI0033BA0F56